MIRVSPLWAVAGAMTIAVGVEPLHPAQDGPRAVRLGDGPIVAPGMPGLEGPAGANINGPSLIRAPAWLPNRLGEYYLYFAHHQGKFIRMAYADHVEGPWTVYEPGTLRLEETAARDHIASPDVHVDENAREIRMYFHGRADTFDGQATYLATSRDGIRFRADSVPLAPPYARVFRHDGWYYALTMARKPSSDSTFVRSGRFYRSSDGRSPFEPGPRIIDEMRHAAVAVRGNTLDVYYTVVGDRPEQIYRVELSVDQPWSRWGVGPPVTILEPALAYEGGNLALAASRSGWVYDPVRELRDPAVFTTHGRTYLLYAVAGEHGIALAEIVGEPE